MVGGEGGWGRCLLPTSRHLVQAAHGTAATSVAASCRMSEQGGLRGAPGQAAGKLTALPHPQVSHPLSDGAWPLFKRSLLRRAGRSPSSAPRLRERLLLHTPSCSAPAQVTQFYDTHQKQTHVQSAHGCVGVRCSNRLAGSLTSKSQEVDMRSVAAFASPSLSVPLSTSLPRFLHTACRCTVQRCRALWCVESGKTAQGIRRATSQAQHRWLFTRARDRASPLDAAHAPRKRAGVSIAEHHLEAVYGSHLCNTSPQLAAANDAEHPGQPG